MAVTRRILALAAILRLGTLLVSVGARLYVRTCRQSLRDCQRHVVELQICPRNKYRLSFEQQPIVDAQVI
jgi:hypothetical protein